MSRGKANLEYALPNPDGFTRHEVPVGRRKWGERTESYPIGDLGGMIVKEPRFGMEIDGGIGEGADHPHSLDVVHVSVRQIDGLDLFPRLPDGADHVGRRRPGIHEGHAAGSRTAKEITGLGEGPAGEREGLDQIVNELPHPQPPVATGFLKVNPDPIMEVT
jgi:hypothetical protein